MPIIYLFNTFSITRMSKFKVKIPMFVKLGPWTTLNIHMQLKSFDHKFPLIKYLWNQYVSSALSVHVVLKQTFWYIYINNAVFLLVSGDTIVYIYIFHTCRYTNHVKKRFASSTDALMYFPSELILTQSFTSML